MTLAATAGGGFQIAGEKTKGGVRPSELNHGNIVFESGNGGVRCRYAEQTTVVSFGALRKLMFPVEGETNIERDDAGRTVLAALGLCAGVLASERGISLRSRCSLVPLAPRVWELIDRPGETPKRYAVDGPLARRLLTEAVAAAEAKGLKWMTEKLVLKPTAELVALVKKSQELQAAKGESEE